MEVEQRPAGIASVGDEVGGWLPHPVPEGAP